MAVLDYFEPDADPRIPTHQFVDIIGLAKRGRVSNASAKSRIEAATGVTFSGAEVTQLSNFVTALADPTTERDQFNDQLRDLEAGLRLLEAGTDWATRAEVATFLGGLA